MTSGDVVEARMRGNARVPADAPGRADDPGVLGAAVTRVDLGLRDGSGLPVGSGLQDEPALLPVPGGDLDALRAVLAQRAADAGALDVAFRTLETDVGALLVAATRVGLVSVTFDGHAPEATLERLAAELSPRILEAPARLDGASRALEALIAGRAKAFAGPLDLSLARGFGLEVVRALQRIPFGETRSYGEVAVTVGSPRAVRAVGTACRRNPLPIAVPCHRVVRSDGSMGQYAGGEAAKRLLLGVEAAARDATLA